MKEYKYILEMVSNVFLQEQDTVRMIIEKCVSQMFKDCQEMGEPIGDFRLKCSPCPDDLPQHSLIEMRFSINDNYREKDDLRGM